MRINIKLTIEKNIQDVWEIMGNQFGHAHLWSSNFISSQPGGAPKFDGLDYSLRDTTTGRGNTIQELTAFDPATFSFSYEITKGAPPIAKMAGASWSLVQASAGTTLLNMEFVMEPKMPLTEDMETKIRMGLTASVTELAHELKYYAEQGEPHPNKVKQIKEAQQA